MEASSSTTDAGITHIWTPFCDLTRVYLVVGLRWKFACMSYECEDVGSDVIVSEQR